ncbi:MAG: 1-deoxy-D-xylulose-5-phosphate reductoisomerase [Acidobacteria bacterium]|nr:1-deoxy-D-xylulose-5-phosphate reductoisomerase [Acidobacteriota bacterium]MCG3193731.1 1-deoxy-D-xylulose 5-phosphate reductoisomerase [Thermoanaerobaculia bacterium]MCK6682873.1 1-deoxy-D-xylulose-5-phosphate reductoisomerase [Thermoanaerobaculia bacterium]
MAGSPKNIALLGATGSIGQSALSVVEMFPEKFRIISMTAGSNIQRLVEAIERFHPKLVSVASRRDAESLKRRFPWLMVGFGVEGLVEAVILPEVTTVLGGIVGSVGLAPAYEAVKRGKTLALANKEVLVVAGELLMGEAQRSGARIIPVDSEHCALHQALRCGARSEVHRLILTASGGPFRNRPLDTFSSIRVEDALAHPTWKMGQKISVDSATMMNKGLEVIEAHWLFGVPARQIDVVLHPQSIVHSIVEYVDGSMIAQMSPNDMRFPILYALTYPERIATPMPRLDLAALQKLEFSPMDNARYPALRLAYAALNAGGTAPAVLNAANEVAVQAFLERRISYNAVVEISARVLSHHDVRPIDHLGKAFEADLWARQEAQMILPSMEKPKPMTTLSSAPA